MIPPADSARRVPADLVAGCRWLGAAAPVVDAVVVHAESVLDAPEDGLGAAGHLDLAVDTADVGLDGVRAEASDGATSALFCPASSARGSRLPGRLALRVGPASPGRRSLRYA